MCIRDSYCDLGPAAPLGTDTRRAYRSVLDILFHALVGYAAPVLVFTSEEVWGTRYPDASSVHLLEWPAVGAAWNDAALSKKWADVRGSRTLVNELIEPMRRDKIIKSSLEAEVSYAADAGNLDLAEIFIVSVVRPGESLAVTRTENHKCGRCWRHLPEVETDGALCNRCDTVLS